MKLFIELLKSILYGIVEGITEWLPISSTGHLILVEEWLPFAFTEDQAFLAEFGEMFQVVIQLGAILAVVILFWSKLWPFSFKKTTPTERKSIWQLWFKVLNLFAYTGGATLAAAEAGASVTHVDASKGMVAWAKENAASSGLSNAPIRWLVDDCVKFVEREIRRGNHYDGIIMDPPSYGRGPNGEIWKIEEAIYPLVKLCEQLLSDDALFFLINSYTTGLAPAVLTYMIGTAICPKHGGHVESDEIGLPVTETGLVLPCGASGRWCKE